MNDESNKELRPKPIPLPATPNEWEAARKIKRERTLNDHVDDIHMALQASPDEVLRVKYNTYLDAVYDEDAVEGSMVADDFEAAAIIRKFAGDQTDDKGNVRDPYVASKKLATLVKALRVVLNRYKASRDHRRITLDGTETPNGE
jgi:transposase